MSAKLVFGFEGHVALDLADFIGANEVGLSEVGL